MNPLNWITAVLRFIGQIAAPMFFPREIPSAVVWVLHLLLVTAIAVGLWFVQKYFAISLNLGGPVWLRPFWLSILFLLVYLLVWQAWWLWMLLQPSAGGSEFPDIDEAWGGVLAALDKAGIGIADTPVFLVLGSTAAPEDALFKAIPRGLVVAGGTAGSAPLRVYASRDAIYLTLPGVTLLDLPAAREAWPTGSDGSVIDLVASVGPLGRSVGLDKSVGLMSLGGQSSPLGQVQQIIRRAKEEGRPLTDAERDTVRKLSMSAGVAGPAPAQSGGERTAVLQDAAVGGLQSARLLHFCRLIADTRWPLTPINGALVDLTVAETEKDATAQQIGLIARQDLDTLEIGMGLRFPVYTLFADLHALPGAGTFLSRFAAERSGQRLGKGFPLNPDVKPDQVTETVEANVAWVFGTLLPYWSLKLAQVEAKGDTSDSATRANAELVRFLTACGDRAEPAARMVSRAVADGYRIPVFAGTYLTANSPDTPGESLFATDFFKKVESTQGYVAWTDDALAADASARRAATLGYAFLVLLLLGVVALGAYVWWVKWR
jgi:hypothetical protein